MDTGGMMHQVNPAEVLAQRVAVMYLGGSDYISGTSWATLPRSVFVDILEMSSRRIILRAAEKIDSGTVFFVRIFAPGGAGWKMLFLESRKLDADPARPDAYIVEAEIRCPQSFNSTGDSDRFYDKTGFQVADCRFLLSMPLIHSLPPEAVCPLLNSLLAKKVRAGERFISQGDPGDAVYLIQEGTCAAIVEKDGHLNKVARLRDGDLVGEMAILTGEKRSAHVEAETDMRLWVLDKRRFEDLAADYQELKIFLTNLMTNWINSRTITAPRKIGKYVITDIIGSGAYSIVYKGFHQVLNMPVAIKMMKHDLAMDPDFLSNFHEEARTIARFNCENIVNIHDIEERYQTVFIIMEYLEGRSLRSELNSLQRLAFSQVVSYLLQICRGLHYAHQRGIVHQDVKPDNIFILPNGKIKILDFGLACRCGTDGRFCGTPVYMSPEQIECMQIDERTDIYSLGIMAYELVTGCRPYPEDDIHRVMDLHVESDIPDPAEAVPELPEGLRWFILKACARDLNRRYREIPEIFGDLKPMAAWLRVIHR
ncbi:MAG: protein kinase [Desulfobacterales bacterium]